MFQQFQDSKNERLLEKIVEVEKAQEVSYLNVANDDTVSMSVEEVLSLGVPTENKWLSTLGSGQRSKQSLCKKKKKIDCDFTSK